MALTFSPKIHRLTNRLGAVALTAICLSVFFLSVHNIDRNIDDPNMIVYMNPDEGGLMDEIWQYYSGQKRETFQWDEDYGLEMLYIADASRLFLSKFITFTPGTFVLILRWFHLIGWILSLVALWRLVKRHFGKTWQPLLAVVLLAVRPAYAYFSYNLKPEPLVLFFMILGLDYTLRITDSPKWKNIIIAIFISVIAFLIKFAGIFLLPAIIAAVYLSQNRKDPARNERRILPKIDFAWIAPSIIGFAVIILTTLAMYFYVRKSTGMTWHDEFGFFGSIIKNKIYILFYACGAVLIAISMVLWVIEQLKNQWAKKLYKFTNEINSYALITMGIFAIFLIFLGFRWLISPKYFILSYAPLGAVSTGTEAINMIGQKGLVFSFISHIFMQIKRLDPIIFSFFVFYMIIEIIYKIKGYRPNDLRAIKRYVLFVFILPSLIMMFSMLKFAQHHMLPFFAAMTVLGLEGQMMGNSLAKKMTVKVVFLSVLIVLYATDIAANGYPTIRNVIYNFKQNQDIAFEAREWFRKNVPADTLMVTDHYIRVYLPPEYMNVKVFYGFQTDRIEQLRKLVELYKPKLIYYNEGPSGGLAMPAIEQILPNKKVKLIMQFDSADRPYQRCKGDKFVVYKLSD